MKREGPGTSWCRRGILPGQKSILRSTVVRVVAGGQPQYCRALSHYFAAENGSDRCIGPTVSQDITHRRLVTRSGEPALPLPTYKGSTTARSSKPSEPARRRRSLPA